MKRESAVGGTLHDVPFASDGLRFSVQNKIRIIAIVIKIK